MKPFRILTEQESRRERIRDAASMLACPYYQGVGHCESGCRTEPSCITDVPDEDGWVGVLIEAELEEPGSVRAALEEDECCLWGPVCDEDCDCHRTAALSTPPDTEETTT